MKNLITTPAPHFHSNDSVRKNMVLVILALMPAYIVSLMAFGWGALITTLISVVACVGFEYLISRFILKEKGCSICDCSAALTGLLLAFNVPSNLDWWIIVVGALIAIGIGKMTFGGLGQNLFNPALVGRAVLLVSFPVQMTTWPKPEGFAGSYVDATTAATPLGQLAEGTMDWAKFNFMDAATGMIGGSLGEVSALALLAGGLFLIITRVITWHIPVAILCTTSAFAALAAACGWVSGVCPCEFALFTLCTGGLMLGAFFMATDYVTSPMSAWGKIVFGIGIGIIVMVIRLWGAYPEGMSFAILIMNACVPLLNKIRPKRFGEKKK